MGRFFGRRPDPTPAIRRALHGRLLEPDEKVLAGVHVQRPGVNEAAIGAAGNAGVSASTGIYAASWGSEGDREWSDWASAAVHLHGIDPVVAKRTRSLTVALTDARLLLVRRSRVLSGRHREVFASWPLTEVDHVRVAHGGSTLSIARGGADLVFELPLSLKFLHPVYVEFPALFDRAQTSARGTGADDPRPGIGDAR